MNVIYVLVEGVGGADGGPKDIIHIMSCCGTFNSPFSIGEVCLSRVILGHRPDLHWSNLSHE